jgi:hypothetical protein
VRRLPNDERTLLPVKEAVVEGKNAHADGSDRERSGGGKSRNRDVAELEIPFGGKPFRLDDSLAKRGGGGSE